MNRSASILVALVALAGCAVSGPSSAPDPAASSPVGLWLAGDLHVHDDHSSDGSLPRQRNKDRARGNNSVADQIGQAERQGLHFLPLTDHRTFDQHYDPLWESSALLLIPGEEANGSPHAIVLGAADSVIQGAARQDRQPFTHVQQSVWEAHSQGGTWTTAHPDDGETNEDGSPNALASVQGVDLVEMWNRASDIEKEIEYCENRWNAGFRFGIAGASDSHFREYWDRQGPGSPTTRVFAEARNERGVIDGLRAGRTSLSAGPDAPLIEFAARFGDGAAMSGDELFIPPDQSGRLEIRTQHAANMDVLVYRAPGRSAGPWAMLRPTRDDETFSLDITSVKYADWYRVEIRGPGAPTPASPAPIELKAAASPIFISPGPVEARAEIGPPSDQGEDDGAELVTGAMGEFVGFPDVATAGNVVHVAAESHPAGASAIVYRRRGADGLWSPVDQKLSGGGVARFPRVAAKGRDVWVVWQEDAVQAPHRPAIVLRHSANGGASWQPPQIVRAIDGRAEHPDIAIAADEKPVVIWQEISAGQPFDVMIQDIGSDAGPRNLSRAGKAIAAASQDDTRSARYPASVWPALAVGPDGRIAAVWQDNRDDIDPLWTGSAAAPGTNPDNWQIAVALRSPKGVWTASHRLGAADAADRHPDVAFADSGELTVVWETKALAPAGRNLSVLAAISPDAGASFSEPTALAPDPLTMSERPRLGVDEDGAVRAVWYDSRSVDWRWRVMTSAHRTGGGWDAGRLVNGRGINTWPATSGGVIVFASTRNAERRQRDRTQQIFLLPRSVAMGFGSAMRAKR